MYYNHNIKNNWSYYWDYLGLIQTKDYHLGLVILPYHITISLSPYRISLQKNLGLGYGENDTVKCEL